MPGSTLAESVALAGQKPVRMDTIAEPIAPAWRRCAGTLRVSDSVRGVPGSGGAAEGARSGRGLPDPRG
jgi:hypothetical protein